MQSGQSRGPRPTRQYATSFPVTISPHSIHRGGEAYVEFDQFSVNGRASRYGNVDLFTSFAYVDARYVSGESRAIASSKRRGWSAE